VCREWETDIAPSVLKDALWVADDLAYLGTILRAWTFVRQWLATVVSQTSYTYDGDGHLVSLQDFAGADVHD
jgi:hypothetical protein